mmetsp:Transcript_30348/g.44908  ORF Transcript_30348/g.44908 Transcript_30348/m.44908 type:complete len:232 (-) Transcript_30348:563-1258(-)|eukprot:CAMPEP_0195517884 /NCGR_PEP_ID=MMETSP0794_2-20130614/11801_1 /TAXON_ID=515487 /ORGANISM="Stephanopyxis turris, Strain CCMP 815" /LENGTH=231 /DNA_ID=CAMNT_0040646761 /DNA_START=32 /DNA_END=727 /DNA_ORIENTATION=-
MTIRTRTRGVIPLRFNFLFLLLLLVHSPTSKAIDSDPTVPSKFQKNIDKDAGVINQSASDSEGTKTQGDFEDDDETIESDTDAANDSADTASTEEGEEETETCNPLGECELCPHQRAEKDECKKTRRRRKFECVVTGSKKRTQKYESCLRTNADEQSLMLRYQLIWLVTGFISMLFVRKHKRSNASLFELRSNRRNGGAIYTPVPSRCNSNPSLMSDITTDVDSGGSIEMK